MTETTAPQASFIHMKDGTAEDWQTIARSFGNFARVFRTELWTT